MKYRGIFEYEYPTEHKPPISIDVHLHGDCVKGKIIEWEYRPLDQEPKTGHWINKQRLFDSCSAECSSCHKRSNGYMHDNGFSLECKYYDFCPNCGTDMREMPERKASKPIEGNNDSYNCENWIP